MTQNDIDQIGSLFDDELYPIDTTAFGRESDVDGDGQVLVLLTDRVTRLAGCNNGQVVVGFFFALDLFEGEVGIERRRALLWADARPGLLGGQGAGGGAPARRVHPRVPAHDQLQPARAGAGRRRRGYLAQRGLSGYAEELGARQVPDARCVNNDCLTQFGIGDFSNAYDFLSSLEENYLIGPATPPLPLTEYGGTWLFVRWLGDHFSGNQPLATDLTRKLVQTKSTGAANVEAATGEDFPTLITAVPPGQLRRRSPAVHARPTTTSPTPAGRSGTSGRRSTQQNPGNFPRPYPLDPDVTSGGYETAGSLLAGSGKHVLIEQAPDDPALDFKITRSDGTTALPASAAARVAVLRIR